MTPNPLINAIEAHEASYYRNGDLSDERVKSLQYYLGEPFGNEVEGRSQVVSRDVADTIEWIKPSLMRIFSSGDEIVSFDPVGPEDVEQAQQESDYVNYILTQKNNWFRTSYVWFTDALMQKNAYVKAWWEEKTDTNKETYEGLTEDQFALIAQDPEVEIVEMNTYPDPSFPGVPPEMAMQMGVAPEPPMLYSVTCQRTSVYGCVKYKEIPPERVIVSSWASSVDLEDVDFFEHFEWKTLSEMNAMGLDLPEDVGDETESGMTDNEEIARNLYGEPWNEDDDSNDKAQKRYKVRECWIKFDDDEDGIAELLHVIVVGKHEVLKEPADFIPAAAITPVMMPHRHVGRSISDQIMDLQLIKSVLLRGTLDNMYLANNGRYGVDEKRVNLDDMLTSRPGGLVRTDGSPHDKILPFVHPNMMAQGLEAIQYIDDIKQNRTGVTAYVTSIDDKVLNKTAAGTNMLQNAAMVKIELIARVFAETGVKRLMSLIHALSLKHARKSEVVRLRNKWVTVDPRQWKKRVDMTVSVGLGTGNRDQQMMHLGTILQIQKDMAAVGLVTPKHIYHALNKFTQAAGFKDPESFWQQPQEGAQMPSPPDPRMEKVKADAQANQMKLQAEGQQEQQRMAMEAQSRQAELQAEIQLKQVTAFIDAKLEQEKFAREQQFEQWKAMLEAQTKVIVAELSAQTQLQTSQISAADQASKS